MKGLLSALSVFILFSASFAQANVHVPSAKNGIIDLSKKDLATDSYTLGGDWGFYWNQLIAPDSLGFYTPVYKHFPDLWNNMEIDGKKLSAQGFATYALTVILPHDHKQLALKLPDVYTCYRLYANDVLLAENGKVGRSANESSPKWQNIVKALPESADTVKLVLQISNFLHSKGGTNDNIVLGDKDAIFHNHELTNGLDFLLAGCLFMCGLFFLSLYIYDTQHPPILYFSLFCLLYSYRVVGADPYALHNILPDIPWIITTRLEYMSMFLSGAFFVLYVYKLYPEEINRKFVAIVTVICSVCTVMALFGNPLVFTQLTNYFSVIVLITIVYLFIAIVVAAVHKRKGALYSLISIGWVMLAFAILNLRYLEIYGNHAGIVYTAYFVFFFLQTLTLSFRFAHSLKKAKREAETAAKAKSQFLSTMSHEIRTPLNALIGMTHHMLSNEPTETQREELEVMLFSAKNLLNIVNDILDFNKLEAGKIKFENIETDMAGLCKKIIAGFKIPAAEKKIKLIADIDNSLDKMLYADPTRTTQVLTNLLHNAIKFTPEGSVTLTMKVLERTADEVTILFGVKDTGIGIAENRQQVIFEQFTQADSSTSRSFGGTGLGLSISKTLLEKQGASLQVKSKEGEGAEFYFEQKFKTGSKLKQAEPAVEAEKTPIKPLPLKGVNVLLVEDSEFNVLVATRFLQSWGAEIEVAGNGIEALEKFDENKHKIILMDIHMPVMDGRDATRALRKKGYNVPIIALTASLNDAEESIDVMKCGANDIIVKPFEPESLKDTLVHHLKIAS